MRTSLRSKSLLATAVLAVSSAASFAALPASPSPVALGGHDTVGGPVSGPEAIVIAYDYAGTGGTGGLTDNSRPTNVGDFGSTVNIPAGFVLDVTQIVVARVNGSVAGNFDIGFYLYDNVNPAAPANSSVNSTLLASGTFNRVVTAANVNQAFTTAFTVTPGSLLLSDANFGVQMVYSTAGSQVANANGTVSYTPNTIGGSAFFIDKSVGGNGNSTNGFFADADSDGFLESTEFFAFAAPNDVKSNVFFQITGDLRAVPEPASMSLLGLGAVTLMARRRKA
ncbi:MAG: PEP-CTERM sorting domain-containing protein [Anaerolineae bacterium]|nr:PEP-CTERM sorting domain-containing protein [Phycisphaerae bacterium]